jgi:hypothetical protein
MPGRKTHDYPHGRPFPIFLLNVAMGITAVLWVIFASRSWVHAVAVFVLFLVIVFIDSRLHKTYERTGYAVRIARPNTVVRFVNGLPVPILALRYAFFVIVAVLLALGLAPVTFATAKVGIIGCILSLFAVAILHLLLEFHYINTGRAKNMDPSRPSATPADHGPGDAGTMR